MPHRINNLVRTTIERESLLREEVLPITFGLPLTLLREEGTEGGEPVITIIVGILLGMVVIAHHITIGLLDLPITMIGLKGVMIGAMGIKSLNILRMISQ
jgi:hypothetical protein